MLTGLEEHGANKVQDKTEQSRHDIAAKQENNGRLSSNSPACSDPIVVLLRRWLNVRSERMDTLHDPS